MFDKNKLSFILFTIVLLTFIIGGYFLTNYVLKTDFSVEESETITTLTDSRIDKTKDYVYYENVVNPIESAFYSFSDVVINFSGFTYLEKSLNSEVLDYSLSIVYEFEYENEITNSVTQNDEGIYSLSYREYLTVEYGNYITLIAEDYDYDIENLSSAIGVQSYTFDKTSGTLVLTSELLDMYDLDIDEIIDTVSDVVSTKSYTNTSIKVSETMEDFEYILYINKVGSLEIMYLVACTNNNYYDTLVLS